MRFYLFVALVCLTSSLFAEELLQPDVVAHAGLKPGDAVKAITLPPGFKVTLFAGEPDIVQPVAFTFDDRGRLWVVEANTYPKKAPPGKGQDRILIFEDSTGAGHFDKRTVFMEGLNLVSGIEYGFGGLWVGQAPELLFIPILEGDKPGKPEVLLDGFVYNDTHETLNSFAWGPDGWLYGCHGVFNPSKVGKPGTPDKDRIPMSAAVWRYHPTKKTFEVFAEGGSNQWGIDWDEHGEMFMTCCVIPHIYHVIQGGRYVRQAGPHANPYTFDDIKTIADHLHWNTGARDQWAANGKSSSLGGGHAHCGAMIYLGDNFPDEYRGRIFMGNIHGNRINTDILEPKGSGFVAHHGPDFMLMNDSWSRIIAMKTGPDGAMYVIDWYDKQACHLNKPEMFDRTNGRIYKVTYKETKPLKMNVAQLPLGLLADMFSLVSGWFTNHARRVLQERGMEPDAQDLMVKRAMSDDNPIVRLSAMLMLNATGTLGELLKHPDFLKDSDPHLRAWHIRLAAEAPQQSPDFEKKLVEMSTNDPSPVVRRQIATYVAQKQPANKFVLLGNLLAHQEDVADPNLPFIYWYAIESVMQSESCMTSNLAAFKCKIPLVQEFVARRLAMSADPKEINYSTVWLDRCDDATKLQFLKGIMEGLIGRRSVPAPESWKHIYDELSKNANPEIRQRALSIATVFGDPRALAELRATLADGKADLYRRQSALDSLLNVKDTDTLAILQTLVNDLNLRGGAIRGLAAYGDPKTPSIVLGAYASFDPATKLAALNTLAARVEWAKELIAAIDANQIPRGDVMASTVRAMFNLGDPAINAWISKNWGNIRATDAEKVAEIKKYKAILKPELIAKANAKNGRAIFTKTCATCHTLFDAGAKIGPELTGANRTNVDYLLENIVDPSAVIGKDYQMVNVKTKDGRFIDGIIKAQTDSTITFATTNEMITLPKSEIASQKISPISMMPEGLLAGLREGEIRDLIKYLGSPAQVPEK